MTLEYKIDEQDFLDFQLFTASKSDRINRKKRNGRIFLSVGSIVVAFYFYLNQNRAMAIYFGLVAIAMGVWYPKYFKWRYKKHYEAFIKENYSKRFGQVEMIVINKDSIFSKNKTGEGKINLSEIDKIDETANHFFLKLSTGLSLLIPKKDLQNAKEVRDKFSEIGLPVNDERNWTWK